MLKASIKANFNRSSSALRALNISRTMRHLGQSSPPSPSFIIFPQSHAVLSPSPTSLHQRRLLTLRCLSSMRIYHRHLIFCSHVISPPEHPTPTGAPIGKGFLFNLLGLDTHRSSLFVAVLDYIPFVTLSQWKQLRKIYPSDSPSSPPPSPPLPSFSCPRYIS